MHQHIGSSLNTFIVIPHIVSSSFVNAFATARGSAAPLEADEPPDTFDADNDDAGAEEVW